MLFTNHEMVSFVSDRGRVFGSSSDESLALLRSSPNSSASCSISSATSMPPELFSWSLYSRRSSEPSKSALEVSVRGADLSAASGPRDRAAVCKFSKYFSTLDSTLGTCSIRPSSCLPFQAVDEDKRRHTRKAKYAQNL